MIKNPLRALRQALGAAGDEDTHDWDVAHHADNSVTLVEFKEKMMENVSTEALPMHLEEIEPAAEVFWYWWRLS